MDTVTLTVTLNLTTGRVEFALPADFLLAQELLITALQESVKRELQSRIKPRNPGVVVQKQGMHIVGVNHADPG